MAGISPYHDAPGADITPPPTCKITAAAFLMRHSSIYANDDEWEAYMQPFVERVKAAQRDGVVLHSSSPLSFLNHWRSPINDDNLEAVTGPGKDDAFEFGKRFRKLYGPLLPPKHLGRKGAKAGKEVKEPFKIWTASSERDIETSKAWIRGAFPNWQEGEDGEGDGTVVSLVKVPNKDADWAESLTPHKICPAWDRNSGNEDAQAWLETYGPPVLQRLRRYAPGYALELNDVIAMGMLCGYESVIKKGRRSPFCSTELFKPDEFRSFGYWNDIRYHHTVGYGSAVAPYLGIGWLNTSTHNLVSAYSKPHPHPNASTPASSSAFFSQFLAPFRAMQRTPKLPPPTAPPDATHTQLLFPYITHREEPPVALVALGLWNTTSLPTDRMPKDRKWKTSHLLPFLGHVALERMSCDVEELNGDDKGEKKDYIRVMVNGAPQQVGHCRDGPGASCEIGRFVEFVNERVEQYKDFEGACKKNA
ncbi:hypothetical protein JCM1841_004381 [Sporobolomyces salmonicolor]